MVDLYGWTADEAEGEVADWEHGDENAEAAGDAVARASDQSFPASDPPGWIKQAPRAPAHASAPPRSGAAQPSLRRRKPASR